jgi:tripartite-type tricarboxylate transporter receptor subunit TctC
MLKFLRTTLVGALAVCSLAALADDGYPNRLIKLVVPYGPGATTDLMARLVAQKVSDDLKQPVIVDNRAGAGGMIGSDAVAKSPADGYTILLATDGTHTGNPFLLKKFPFDAINDVTPISLAAKNLMALVAHPSVPVKNVRELIDYAKRNPGTLSYGSSGNGSPHHLAGILFNQMAGTDITHVPYKGGGPSVVDVLGGQIPLAFVSLATVMPHLQSGKLRLLGTTEKKRAPEFPDLPTVAETLPGFEMDSWLGFVGPANLPPAVLQKLNESINKALKDPGVAAKLNEGGLLVIGSTPKEFADQLRAGYEKRGRLIQQNNIKLD